jgi:hypothetical protein
LSLCEAALDKKHKSEGSLLVAAVPAHCVVFLLCLFVLLIRSSSGGAKAERMLLHVDGSIVLPGNTLDANGQVVNLQQQQADFAVMNNEFGIPGLNDPKLLLGGGSGSIPDPNSAAGASKVYSICTVFECTVYAHISLSRC